MKALVLAARHPWPPLRGDQMRARDFAAGLQDLGYRVEVLCAQGSLDGDQSPKDMSVTSHAPSALDRVRGLVDALAGAPLQSIPFRSTATETAALDRLEGLGNKDVVVIQLVRQLHLLETVVRALRSRPEPERPRVVVDLIDTLSLNFAQRARLDRPWLRPLWSVEARRLRRAEVRVTELADSVCLVCKRDLQELSRVAPQARTKAAVVPLPVVVRERSRNGRDPMTVALTGNLGYFVNDLAARWFAGEVWPLVLERCPKAVLVVAGARPGRRLQSLLQLTGATLIADPKDLRSVLGRATVAVAPLFGGAGVPVKVLEAWAESVPIVVSAWAAAGVSNGAGQAAERALVSLPDGSSPQVWADAIQALLGEPARRSELARLGRDVVQAEHSAEAFRRALESVLKG